MSANAKSEKYREGVNVALMSPPGFTTEFWGPPNSEKLFPIHGHAYLEQFFSCTTVHTPY
jgi:hypothetical protein